MVNIIPKSVRKKAYRCLYRKSPVLWANYGWLSALINRQMRPLQPAILILSLPRSGSSWVGEMLGASPSAMYLREPITQTYISRSPGKPSFFEIDKNHPPQSYVNSAANVFSGMPLFDPSIIRFPKQWSLLKRRKKRIVIKEVNPLALAWIIEQFQPRIIYLIRHPAAVAQSFSKLEWTGRQFETRFFPETLESKIQTYKDFTSSFWSEHGALQAVILRQTLELLQNYGNFKLIKFEDICADPLAAFRELFDFAELNWNKKIQDYIEEHTLPSETDDDNYGTFRNSRLEINKWRDQIPKENLLEIKNAYLSFDPPYYKQQQW